MNKQNKKAFTIIEAVLVLAVAGLIFLVVFAAIPRLQASRRDNQRKRDAEAIVALMTEYKSNTGSQPSTATIDLAFKDETGAPTGASTFDSYVVNENLENPSTGSLYIHRGTVAAMLEGDFYYATGQICNTTGTGVLGGNTGDWIFFMRLERGYYCLDSR